MGLDVSAYSRIRKLDCVFDADGEPIDPATREPIEGDFFRAYHNPSFPGRADDVEDGAIYTGVGADGFNAGGYGGYSHWRDKLAKLAGYPEGTYEQYGRDWPSHCVACWSGAEGPFSELINFADNEGVIGAQVSKKLAADFQAFQEKAEALGDEGFLTKYNHWRAAFELASDAGCVHFY